MDYQQQILLTTVQRYNILPVTSHCKSSCIFCSHRQNPKSIRVYNFGQLSMETVNILIPFLDDKRKIVIGESATRLIEGEPFCHPDFKQILYNIREQYPNTLISITTNGNFLNDDWFRVLEDVKPIEINYSVNVLDFDLRKKVMGNAGKYPPSYIMEQFAEYNILYHGSIVSMNWLTGWHDLEELIMRLEVNNCSTIRIFLPGYTKFTHHTLKMPKGFSNKLCEKVKEYEKKYTIPITLEPIVIKTLKPQVDGVIRNSLADKSGMKKGDIITKVDNFKVLTRVDAFNTIKKKENPIVTILREGIEESITLNKRKGESPGLVMYYDIDSSLLDSISGYLRSSRSQKGWLFVSELGYNIISELVKKYAKGLNLELVAVQSNFFAGSIKAAGLLLLEDFLDAFKGVASRVSLSEDLIILPAIAFDHNGYDLCNRNYSEFEDLTGVKTIIL
jgi:hypothetical protein